jgi:hypothetical protein
MTDRELALELAHQHVPSRRERIATAVLQGLLSSGIGALGGTLSPGGPIDSSRGVGERVALAVEYADALLAELEKNRSEDKTSK